MKPKKAVKQLERQLRNEPTNLVLRVKLAAALRDAGRTRDAVALYRGVAIAYEKQGRLSQAAAVCRSALELDPDDAETVALLRQLEAVQSTRQESNPTTVWDDSPSIPSLNPQGGDGMRVRSWDSRSRRGSDVPRLRRPSNAPARPRSPSGAPPRSRPPASAPPRYSRPANSERSHPPSTVPPPRRNAPPTTPQRLTTDEHRSRPPGVPDRLSRPRESPRPTPGGGHAWGPPLPRPTAPERRGAEPARRPPLAPPRESPPPTRSSRRRSLPELPSIPRLSSAGGGHEFDDDAATRIAGGASASAPPEAPADEPAPIAPGAPYDDPDQTVVRPSPAGVDDGEPMTQVFGGSFAETLGQLAPDGSAIDVPMSLFSELSAEARSQLEGGMVPRQFDVGEVIVREGEPGDACFVIAAGEVRVLKREPTDPHGEQCEIARLGDGAVFGEFALLADRRRHATVQAVRPTSVFEIPRRLASELAATYAEVRPALERFYRERVLSTLLTTTPLFRPLPAERRGELLARFLPHRSESGQQIVTEGTQAGGLFLIVLGSVEITRRMPDRRSVLLAALGEGAYFGEMSLLHGEPASASVTATGPTELAVLPAAEFYDLVAEYPVLWETMRQEAGRRTLETHRIVTGNTSVV